MSNDLKRAVQLGWDAMSDSYQEQSRISVDDVHYAPFAPGERTLRLLDDVRGKRALELACGAAQNAIALSRWGARVTAMDFSTRQLRHARLLIEECKADVRLVRGDMERPAMFRSESFDLVLSSFGWEFVPGPGRQFQRVPPPPLARRAAGGQHGTSAIGVRVGRRGAGAHRHGLLQPARRGLGGLGPASGHPLRTFQELHGLLTDSGFVVERVVEPYPAPPGRGVPYSGEYWADHAERLARVPFAIVFKARKPQ